MPGRSTSARPLQFLGALDALFALASSTGFGWGFEEVGGVIPFALGAAGVLIALGWAVRRRR